MFFTVNNPPKYEYQMLPKSKNTMIYPSMHSMYNSTVNAGGEDGTRDAGKDDGSGRKKVTFQENAEMNRGEGLNKQLNVQKQSLTTMRDKKMVSVLTNGKEMNVNIHKLKEELANSPQQEERTPSKPMKWGQPTWFLFHTLAEKIKEENFSEYRMEILKTIYLICTALPCPDCTKHATEYMNNINFNAIRTKHDLKMMLYTFHNTVNIRKKYAVFKQEELSQYEKANTLRVIQHFMVNYTPNVRNGLRVDINRYYRQNVAEKLVQWFNKHLYLFDK
jgi:hypothetical protein